MINLDVVELKVQANGDKGSEDFKIFDLLRPVCLTSYDLGSLCILGGSQHFLQSFNTRFLRLFEASKTTYTCLTRHRRKEKIPETNEFSEKSEAFSDRWICTKPPYEPELLHQVFLGIGQTTFCILSPLEEHLALTAVAELDPTNILEYATNYRMWTSNSCWPPKMFHKVKSGAKKFFHFSQIPLAVLCWANEFINAFASSESEEPTDTEDVNDPDEILELANENQATSIPFLRSNYKNALVTCINSTATVRNAPPAWIYIIREKKQRVSIESKHDLPNQ